MNPTQLNKDLDSCWEVLAEPVQTVMRRYGIEKPYEKLKDLTRDKEVNQQTLREFIRTLDLPETVREELAGLTPSTYTGNAGEQARSL